MKQALYKYMLHESKEQQCSSSIEIVAENQRNETTNVKKTSLLKNQHTHKHTHTQN